MRLYQACAGLIAATLLLTGCAVAIPQGETGSIAILPYWSDVFQLRGVAPATCRQIEQPGVFDCTGLTSDGTQVILTQQAMPVTKEELGRLVAEAVALESLPAPSASYRGAALAWETYAYDAPVPDLGPQIWRQRLALAQGPSASYLVALLAPPASWEAQRALLGSVFTHALYGLTPLE